MKICDCKENKLKKGVKDESLCYSICDLLCNLKGIAQWIMALLSLLLTLCVVFITDLTNCQLNKITDLYLSVFPSTLGLSIAAYAIIIGFQSETLKKLLKEDAKRNKPFHVICASMIFNGLLQTITIILTFAYQLSSFPILFYFSTFGACCSLLQILDILLQLLGLRTFVANNDNN